MAINMALGFLFLGSGAFTFSRNKFAIASLMCALYPLFPRDPNDNRYHLQALRHFWVMAIESRLVQARDIDSGEYVQVDIQLKRKSGAKKTVQTPAIIDDDIESLEVKNDGYFPLSIKLINGKIQQNNLEQVIYIKKRNL